MRALPVFVSAFSVLLLAAPPSHAQEIEGPPAGAQSQDEEEASAEDVDTEAGEEEAEPAKPKVPLPGDDVDDAEPEPALIPAAPDTLAGHLQLSPAAMVVVPFGKVTDRLAYSDLAGTGVGFSLDAGIGLSRSVVLGAWGQFVRYMDDCIGCSQMSLAGGAFIRYHLVQGVRFDPWLSAGVGIRSLAGSDTTVQASGEEDSITSIPPLGSYTGLDFLRFQIGGDWYPARFFGFGPFVELDAGTHLSRPEGAGDAAVYFQFATGLRLTLDVPGK